MKAERVQQQQQQKEIKYTSQELEVELTTLSYPTKYVMIIFISLGTILCVSETRKSFLLEPGQKLETKLEFPQLNRETPLLFVYTSWPSQWIKR